MMMITASKIYSINSHESDAILNQIKHRDTKLDARLYVHD